MHMIDMSNGRANIAYVGNVPWHGLGFKLQEGASIDEWREASGLNWEVRRAAAFAEASINGKKQRIKTTSDILFRDDTYAELGIVSKRYNPVQPSEIFDFYSDISEAFGFKMETAGSLSGGRRIWCLASVGDGFELTGGDVVLNYVLLATSYDKTMATRAMFTSIRVVCNNTLSVAMKGGEGDFVSIPHSTKFSKDKLKVDLGMVSKDGFGEFAEVADQMSQIKLNDSEAVRYLVNVFEGNVEIEDLSTRKANIIKNVFEKYKGNGMGASLESSKDTVWGLLNSITEYVDHDQGRTADTRLTNAWFGQGSAMKKLAYKEAVELINTK